MVGRSFVVDEAPETKTSLPDEEELIITTGPRQSYLEKTLASLATAAANDYKSKAEHLNKKIEQMQWATSDIVKKNKSFKKKRNFWKKNSSFFVIGFAVLGFLCGAILAIAKYMDIHGPTETVLETLIAYIIYGVAGLVVGCIFGVLTSTIIKDVVRHYENILKENNTLLENIRFEKEISKVRIKKYLDLENAERAKARKYGGL